jgi:hypothetical protein
VLYERRERTDLEHAFDFRPSPPGSISSSPPLSRTPLEALKVHRCNSKSTGIIEKVVGCSQSDINTKKRSKSSFVPARRREFSQRRIRRRFQSRRRRWCSWGSSPIGRRRPCRRRCHRHPLRTAQHVVSKVKGTPDGGDVLGKTSGSSRARQTCSRQSTSSALQAWP